MTISEEAKYRIDKQCEKGLEKYGHLLDNAGCGEEELINHAIEEVADLFQYLIALKRKMSSPTIGYEEHKEIVREQYRDGNGY